MTAHAVLSASASKRWLTCTPSARLEATLPEIKRSAGSFDYSQEGTMAHTLAEVKLRHHYGQIGFEEFKRDIFDIPATFVTVALIVNCGEVLILLSLDELLNLIIGFGQEIV